MKNIVLARVDDRLIHTEILTLWVPEVRANRIIIVDDVVAKDKFRSKVIKEMAPQGLIIHVYGIDRATEKLKEAPSFDGERVIVIAESPLVFEELIKRGIKINQLNIGGMGIRGERKAVARRVACDTMEMEAIHELIKKHVHVYFQTVPTRSSRRSKKIHQRISKIPKNAISVYRIFIKRGCIFLSGVILMNIELALDISEC